jgi:hypothetical protein
VYERQQTISAVRFNPADLDTESGGELTQERRLSEGEFAGACSIGKTRAYGDSKFSGTANILQIAGPVRSGTCGTQSERQGGRCAKKNSRQFHSDTVAEALRGSAPWRMKTLVVGEGEKRGKGEREPSQISDFGFRILDLAQRIVIVVRVSPAPLLPCSSTQLPSGTATTTVGCDKIGTMVENTNDGPGADLRPVIARLREIERKCASMGSRNEEFPLMQDRVASIIARLESAGDPESEALNYRRIARELFPVAHLFESTGFLSVGKEIAYIERSLIELAPDFDAAETTAATAGTARIISTSAAKQTAGPPPEEPESEPESRSVPLPILFGFLILVMALAISAAVVFRFGPFARDQRLSKAEPTAVIPEPTMPPIDPTPLPNPAPTAPPNPQPTRIQRGLLAEEVAAARLALAKGDLETAAVHLSEAARIDRKEPDLEEIADQVVRGLVSWAYAAAHNAEWDKAEPFLERAERTAMRFGIDTRSIEQAREGIAAMERFVVVGSGDRTGILRSVGKRVEVALAAGAVRSGRIEGIDDGNLVLNMDRQVGGGVVRYTEEIPLADINSLKIYDD